LTAQLQDQYSNMQSSISWLNNLSTGALIIGIIALIVAVVVVAIKFKKK
jgi:hypothetical protein